MNCKSFYTKWALLLGFVVLFSTSSHAGASFTIGTDGFYLSVGDYDYLPYAYSANPGFAPPPVSFRDALGEYGSWYNVPPFGPVWQPYVAADWRPYLYGRWLYTTQYGPMWEGYEPWAWIGYHYGNWVFTRSNGWVWVPGYDWHPGRVAWANSYNSIGWMPAPPPGYDYSSGDISYVGPQNQFTYEDRDFGVAFESGSNGYNNTGYSNYGGGAYQDPRYRDMYFNQGYSSVVPNLWIFINASDFDRDNVADSYLGPQYARDVFDRHAVRIEARNIQRPAIERIVRHPLRETSVEVHEVQADQRKVKVVVPASGDAVERIRTHSKQVVDNVIAPAFAQKDKAFKGQNARNKDAVSRIFQQNEAAPRVQQVPTEEIVKRADEVRKTHQQAVAERENTARRHLEAQQQDSRQQQTENNKPNSRQPDARPNDRSKERPDNTPENRPDNNPNLRPENNRPDQHPNDRVNERPDNRPSEKKPENNPNLRPDSRPDVQPDKNNPENQLQTQPNNDKPDQDQQNAKQKKQHKDKKKDKDKEKPKPPEPQQ